MKQPSTAYISGEKLHKIRTSKKIYPADFARKMGKPGAYASPDIKYWEDTGKVPFILLGRICEVLGCSLRDLMEE